MGCIFHTGSRESTVQKSLDELFVSSSRNKQEDGVLFKGPVSPVWCRMEKMPIVGERVGEERWADWVSGLLHPCYTCDATVPSNSSSLPESQPLWG